jgi:hypothetical protein
MERHWRPILDRLLAILRTTQTISALRPSFISVNQIHWPPNFVYVLSTGPPHMLRTKTSAGPNGVVHIGAMRRLSPPLSHDPHLPRFTFFFPRWRAKLCCKQLPRGSCRLQMAEPRRNFSPLRVALARSYSGLKSPRLALNKGRASWVQLT